MLALDHDQVMTAAALVVAAYAFLEEEQARGQQARQAHATIGETRAAVQRAQQRHVLQWLQTQCEGGATPEMGADALAA